MFSIMVFIGGWQISDDVAVDIGEMLYSSARGVLSTPALFYNSTKNLQYLNIYKSIKHWLLRGMYVYLFA